ELRQRPPQDVRVAAHVQTGVIARSFNPIDIGDTQEQYPALTSDYESLCFSRLRRPVAAQQLEYVKAVAFGHLHVEKHQVGARFSNLLNSLQPGPTLGDGSNV